MLEYSFPYVVVAIIYLLLGYYEFAFKNNIIQKRKIQIIECIIFVLFFGLRGYIGTDWMNYLFYYENKTDALYETGSFELGFDIVVKLCSSVNIDYCVFVFLITIVQGYLFDKYFSKKVDYMFWTYLLLIAIFPNLIIDTLRNFISLLIGVLALEYWKNEYRIKALLLIVLSILFHTSGVVFFFLLLFCKKYIKKRVIIILFIVASILYFGQVHFASLLLMKIGDIVGGFYGLLIEEYVGSEYYNSSYGISFGVIEKFLFFILYIYKYDEIRTYRYIDPVVANVFFFYILSNLLFSDMNILIQRFAVLFCFGYIIVIPNLINIYRLKINRYLVSFVILFVVMSKVLVVYNIPIFDYTFFFMDNKSLEERKMILDDFYLVI
ncbi:EpsG family protein [uncultured Bacteroides sp.]|uniref:EpsG family protein n=1 Tax=uncultured Bacteroides sp. TaxID=162156 RepID=UPI002624C57D|nr:EpsG family protein [uncultured Bacteroides sp.]